MCNVREKKRNKQLLPMRRATWERKRDIGRRAAVANTITLKSLFQKK
jgi:hypothetical protein